MLAAMGWAAVLLVVALLFSFGLWLTRPAWPSARVLPVYAVALLLQVAHLAEEYRAGFYRVFPPVLGQAPWSARQFLLFNIVWLAVFVVGGIGVWRGWQPMIVVALFLAVGGGVANGAGHLLLAANAGGYFPGAYTAPLLVLIGSLLLFRLVRPPIPSWRLSNER
jgi:hypothetical protein